MENLFHKFQSRQFQFDLELMSRLWAQREVSNRTLFEMAQHYGLEHADKCVAPLVKNGVLEKHASGVRLAEGFTPPQIPPSELEEDYLQYILNLPEAKLFLHEATLSSLREPSKGSLLARFQQFGAQQAQALPDMSPETFHLLIHAIRGKRWIHYAYRSRDNDTPTQAQAVPWKLEYSAFDRRWWIILYLPEQQRTVKAWLANLREIRLGKYSNITEQDIEDAMEKLLVEEPVTLRILPEKNALDRCSRVFERQMLQQIQREPNGHYRLTFRYYRFDENEILRKLLYLGPAVQLLGPGPLCKKLLQMIDRAIECNSYQF